MRISDWSSDVCSSDLMGVANAIRACLRSSDKICRWGGAEFLVVLRNCDQGNAESIAETVRQTVEGAALAFNGAPIPVTVRLGVATLGSGQTGADLFAAADAAL